jgi:hypothetical protein
VLRETGLDARRLEIEITETVAVDHNAGAAEVLARVRELGVSVAIDDFGMGHSALNRLQSFPVDRLKIDRAFVAPLVTGTERGSLAEAMIAMGRALGLQVVAEGVETPEHLGALRALGCPSAQGYLFSRPVPAEAIERLAGTKLVIAALEGEQRAPGERLIRNLLGELQRMTGLESTYVTRIDWPNALQTITHVRNAGSLEIPEGLDVDWSDTVCRLALDQGVNYTDDVAASFPGSAAAREMGLRTYVGVPILGAAGTVQGTLCGVSSQPIELGPDAVVLMKHLAEIIAAQEATQAVAA